ncbi:MFS transporter [Bacillus nakamurai]|uniref:MFS transporter n=1 Tax=Bacillus nakamurai TaxID=1793963 RepID=UPI0035A0D73C
MTDPIVGSAIDYRKHIGPRGKFRPYLLFGSIVLAILTVLIFVSPDVSVMWKLVYAYASYMLWGVAYSFVNIPYGSLGAAHTGCGGQNRAFRISADRIAWGAIDYECHRYLVQFDNVHIGYPAVMGMMAVIGIAGFMICYRNCKERIIVREAPKEKLSAGSVLKSFIGNKPLLTVVFMTIFRYRHITLNQQCLCISRSTIFTTHSSCPP